MYMNRLRNDDFLKLFDSVGHNVLDSQIDTDPQVHNLLSSGHFHTDESFNAKSKEILSTTRAWIISQKKV